MDFNNIPIFNVMKSKLGYLSARQSVLAQNVANADTPDYKARDIEEPDFKHMARTMANGTAQKLPMQVTNTHHLLGKGSASMMMHAHKRPSTYELNPNGNNVVIEEEMMRVAENQADYQQVLSVYRKTIDLFKTAIGRPGGG